ncbi:MULTISPECIES: hypothetical protein [Pyrobaculum]|uniref:Uncharacterized protein n=2 Tax=Pyrobaculum aerophilum TaxID=13773 RepID=Q8ZV28_PYRAE|nr:MULTISPECIES: hypothetical protein [Pyrobaculum]AAL64228.1 hypothetical protein PAE2483 [Pyrobaculum aerophilum str. IM2]MCY0891392.1 hypothetical protein [Pyrobaculum arsenaticum]HII47013.1 hypothetical protein [Pyrobaculum aerophilum]
MINASLLEAGYTKAVKIHRYVYFGLFEHDVEKYVLPYLLPLRVPVLTRWSDVPLWGYLGRPGVYVSYDVIAEIKRISVETLCVDMPGGGLPEGRRFNRAQAAGGGIGWL